MSMVTRTDRDLRSGVTTVWMSVELTWATAANVRAVLAECVVECPVAVIVELSGLRADRSGVAGLFLVRKGRPVDNCESAGKFTYVLVCTIFPAD
jgi:hypothetical protein